MALEIKWTKRADKKFDRIINYLLIEWGENVSKSFVKTTFNFLEILSEYPEIGSLENKEKGIRGFTIVKQINLFCRIKKNEIVLLDFFDNRQNKDKKRF